MLMGRVRLVNVSARDVTVEELSVGRFGVAGTIE
jgi:hypothetical protein